MRKKIISIFTVIAFTVFSLSCYSTKAIKIETGTNLEGKELKITKLQKKSGEYFEFPKKQSAQISRGIIVGNIILKEYVLDKSDIKKTEYGKKGETIRITTNDGKNLNVAKTQEANEKLIVVAYEYSRIPLSEIDIIWVKKTNILATIGVIYLGLAIFSAAVLSLGDRQMF